MSALLCWTSKLSVGFVPIDTQHKHLVEVLNLLDDGVRKGYSRRVLRGILVELTRYTQCHFTFEERLIATWQTPGAQGHIDEHQRFVLQLMKFNEKFDQGRVDISDELLNFLKDWLSGHIMGTDRDLARSLLKAGATSR